MSAADPTTATFVGTATATSTSTSTSTSTGTARATATCHRHRERHGEHHAPRPRRAPGQRHGQRHVQRHGKKHGHGHGLLPPSPSLPSTQPQRDFSPTSSAATGRHSIPRDEHRVRCHGRVVEASRPVVPSLPRPLRPRRTSASTTALPERHPGETTTAKNRYGRVLDPGRGGRALQHPPHETDEKTTVADDPEGRAKSDGARGRDREDTAGQQTK